MIEFFIVGLLRDKKSEGLLLVLRQGSTARTARMADPGGQSSIGTRSILAAGPFGLIERRTWAILKQLLGLQETNSRGLP